MNNVTVQEGLKVSDDELKLLNSLPTIGPFNSKFQEKYRALCGKTLDDNTYHVLVIDETKRAGEPLKALLTGHHNSIVLRLNTEDVNLYSKVIETLNNL